jgi:cation transport regulator ChaB
MVTANAITADQLTALIHPRTTKASQLYELTRRAYDLEKEVREHWTQLPAEKRDLFKAVAYAAVEPKKDLQTLLLDLVGSAVVAWALIRGEKEALLAYTNACNALSQTILDAIEREHPDYEPTVTAAVEEAVNDNPYPAMDADEFRSWLKDVSDKTLS